MTFSIELFEDFLLKCNIRLFIESKNFSDIFRVKRSSASCKSLI